MRKDLILQVFNGHPFSVYSIDAPGANTNYRKAFYVEVDGYWILRDMMPSNGNGGIIGVEHTEADAKRRLLAYLRREARIICEKEGYHLVDKLK